MHLSSKLPLDILSGGIKIGVVQAVTNDHEVNVAVSRINSLCYRAVHEGTLDSVGIWLEIFLDWLGQADRFLNEPTQVFEDRSRLVCPVVLLITYAVDRHQATSFEF